MKKNYRVSGKGYPFLFALCLLAACSQDLSYQEAMNKNQRKIEDPEKLVDANFLVETKSNNLLQVKLTDLAAKSGYASAIVNLAKKQMDQLKDMTEDIDNLARKENITVPDIMDDADQGKFYDVSKSDREDFDKAFVQTLKQINDDNIQRFLAMATDARDADVRAFAARHLDVFRTHSENLAQVEKDLLNTY
jgi:putative membrane protein